MSLKPCLVCGEPSARSRCPEHWTDGHDHDGDRGYNAAWRRLSRKARRLQPFCTDCGTTEDLQADHTPEAWARHAAGKTVRLEDIDVVCGPCNRSRGAARPGATRGGDRIVAGQKAEGKAQSPLHTPGGYP